MLLLLSGTMYFWLFSKKSITFLFFKIFFQALSSSLTSSFSCHYSLINSGLRITVCIGMKEKKCYTKTKEINNVTEKDYELEILGLIRQHQDIISILTDRLKNAERRITDLELTVNGK